jgi:hypothetical protein
MSNEAEQQQKRWDLKNPWVRGGIVGLVILIAATALKTYQESQQVDPEAERAAISSILEHHHEALEENLSKASDKSAFLQGLPEHSGWLPAHMQCGQESVERGALPASWTALWAPLEGDKDKGEATRLRYQLAFVRAPKAGTMTWFARRDGDCDGIYEVHTMRLEGGLSGALKQNRIEVQNLGE